VVRERHDFRPGESISGSSAATNCRPVERRSTSLRRKHESVQTQDFLKISAGLAQGGRRLIWVKDAHAQWNSTRRRTRRCACCAGADSSRATSPVHGERPGSSKRSTASRCGWTKRELEDGRPKAAVAANTGAGPDIILGTTTTPIFTRIAGRRHRSCQLPRQEIRRLLSGLRGLSAPGRQALDRHAARAAGSMMVYRESMLRRGFNAFRRTRRFSSR